MSVKVGSVTNTLVGQRPTPCMLNTACLLQQVRAANRPAAPDADCFCYSPACSLTTLMQSTAIQPVHYQCPEVRGVTQEKQSRRTVFVLSVPVF